MDPSSAGQYAVSVGDITATEKTHRKAGHIAFKTNVRPCSMSDDYLCGRTGRREPVRAIIRSPWPGLFASLQLTTAQGASSGPLKSHLRAARAPVLQRLRGESVLADMASLPAPSEDRQAETVRIGPCRPAFGLACDGDFIPPRDRDRGDAACAICGQLPRSENEISFPHLQIPASDLNEEQSLGHHYRRFTQ